VQHGDRSTGLLVSWVQQAAFDPPSISVCVKSGRPAIELIEAARCFVLNVIGAESTPWFKHFGKGFALNEDAFAGLSVEPSEFGPVLTDCIAHLGCSLQGRIEVGDHVLYAAAVQAGGVRTGADIAPYVHIRKTGLSY